MNVFNLFKRHKPLTLLQRECAEGTMMKGGQNPVPAGPLVRPPAPGGSGIAPTRQAAILLNGGARMAIIAAMNEHDAERFAARVKVIQRDLIDRQATILPPNYTIRFEGRTS